MVYSQHVSELTYKQASRTNSIRNDVSQWHRGCFLLSKNQPRTNPIVADSNGGNLGFFGQNLEFEVLITNQWKAD